MTRKLVQIGTSLGVTLPKENLVGLGIRVGDNIDIRVDGERGVIVLEPVRRKKRKAKNTEVLQWTKKFIERYRPALEALAKK